MLPSLNMTPILAVLDDEGSMHFRITPTSHTTFEYGALLARLAVHIAEMMQAESEGRIKADHAHDQIIAAFNNTPADIGANPPQLPH